MHLASLMRPRRERLSPGGVGRRPRVPGARIVLVTIEMTEEERAQLRAAAQLQGQSMSDYIRVTAGGAAAEDLERLERENRRVVQVDVARERRGRVPS